MGIVSFHRLYPKKQKRMNRISKTPYKYAFFTSLLVIVLLSVLIIVKSQHTCVSADYENFLKEINSSDTFLCNESTSILKRKVVDSGDEVAYSCLLDKYMDCDDGEFLPYALIMANKWHKPQGYMGVYEELTSLYMRSTNDSIDIMDTASRNMALSYLIQGYVLATDSSFKEYIHSTILSYYEKGKYIAKNRNGYAVMK